MLMTNADHTAH